MGRIGSLETGGGCWNRVLVADLEQRTSRDEVLDAAVLNEYYDLRGWDRLGIPTVETARRLSTVGPGSEGRDLC